jgi:imidazolonepropionase-like amidohydrolase
MEGEHRNPKRERGYLVPKVLLGNAFRQAPLGTLAARTSAKQSFGKCVTKQSLVTSFAVLLATLLFGSLTRAHDSIPGEPQKTPIALIGGKVFLISGEPIEDGIVLFEKGKLTKVGKDVELPEGTQRIDAKGKYVYPGLFDAHTNLGLVEIPSVRATLDERESGLINPNVEAIKAVHPDSELFPVTRSGGVLLALSSPDGPLLAGRSSVIQLDGWTWEEMLVARDVGMHLRWPALAPGTAGAPAGPRAGQIKARNDQIAALKRAFEDAAAYKIARDAAKKLDDFAIDARWEALLPVLDGKQPLMVHANGAQEIEAAIDFAATRKLKIVICGGYDAEHCADLLKKHSVPVVILGTYRLPLRTDDGYDAPFTLPERLRAAGVRFCISGGGKHSTENTRNLPYHAAMAAGFGLSEAEAVRAITLSPAEILGVANRVGSLESGKDATLIVASGNILDTATRVEQAWIQGRAVDLSDRQKKLQRKYQQKYEWLPAGDRE